jgi:hypothetical protein
VLGLNRQFFPEAVVPSAMLDLPLAAIGENTIALKDSYGPLALLR